MKEKPNHDEAYEAPKKKRNSPKKYPSQNAAPRTRMPLEDPYMEAGDLDGNWANLDNELDGGVGGFMMTTSEILDFAEGEDS